MDSLSHAQQDHRGILQGKNTWLAGIMPIGTLLTNKAPINSLNSQKLTYLVTAVFASNALSIGEGLVASNGKVPELLGGERIYHMLKRQAIIVTKQLVDLPAINQ
ncbi:hypothetical protein [Agarivorans sp. DSG3-1]|uniref:hypothetical protein n=1 Tax=Agarivorans sp. DSG3-1 TaxID=3342249 RepID=UPI00398E4CAB